MGWHRALNPTHELPRTRAALHVHETFLQGSCELAECIGEGAASALDGVVASHIFEAIHAQAREVLHAMRNSVTDATVQESGCRFIDAVVKDDEAKSLLISLGVRDVLAAAIKAHPRHRSVQDQAQFALMRMFSWRAPLDVLRVSELAASPEAVSAALWSLSSGVFGYGISTWDTEALASVPMTNRRELASLAQAAMARFRDDAKLCVRALDVIGLMLDASVPDADHEASAAAVPAVVEAMNYHQDNTSVQWNAWRALARLTEGNGPSIRALQSRKEEFNAFLDTAMAKLSNYRALNFLCRVRLAVFGVLGVLETARSTDWSRIQLDAMLDTIGDHGEECDTSVLIQTDAVGFLCTRGLSDACSAPSGIAALGRVVEFLVQDATLLGAACDVSAYQRAIERGIDAIVCRLKAEVEVFQSGAKPTVQVYARALVALRNLSCRSDHLAAHLAASPIVKTAVTIALERDYFGLDFETLRQLVAAVSFFSGLSNLLELLERYPQAPMLHECACRVLVWDAEHQDGSMAQGSILNNAAALSFYATKLLSGMVVDNPNPKYRPEKLAMAAVELLGHVLGAVEPDTFMPAQRERRMRLEVGNADDEDDPWDSSPRGPVLEDAVVAITRVLKQFPKSAPLAAEVCRSCVRVKVAMSAHSVQSAEKLLTLMCAAKTGDAILNVVSRFPDATDVVNEATLALGILGGFAPVVRAMRARPSCLLAQQAGCRALTDMCRLCPTTASREAVDAACAAVEAAKAHFGGQSTAVELQTKAELALGHLRVLLR